jgi:hypothetical protein
MHARIDSLESGQLSPAEFVAAAFADAGAPGTPTPQAALDLLGIRARELEHELRAAVCANSDELVQNATDVKYLRDHVVGLKGQIARARSEARAVAGRLLEPFCAVQAAARQLQNNFAVCRRLRVLSRFLVLAERRPQAAALAPPLKFAGDVRALCEIRQIARGGELAGIAAFEREWGALAPACDRLVPLAEAQFAAAVEAGAVEAAALPNAIGAAYVLAHLGAIERVARAAFASLAGAAVPLNRAAFQKCSAETIGGAFGAELAGLAARVGGLCVMVQALGQFAEAEPRLPFDIQEFAPAAFLRAYAAKLRAWVAAMARQQPVFGTAIAHGMAGIRRVLAENMAKLPASVNREEASAIVSEAFQDFVKADP